jgi:hypothetical protein
MLWLQLVHSVLAVWWWQQQLQHRWSLGLMTSSCHPVQQSCAQPCAVVLIYSVNTMFCCQVTTPLTDFVLLTLVLLLLLGPAAAEVPAGGAVPAAAHVTTPST